MVSRHVRQVQSITANDAKTTGMKLVLPARFISEVVSNNSLSFFDSLSHVSCDLIVT